MTTNALGLIQARVSNTWLYICMRISDGSRRNGEERDELSSLLVIERELLFDDWEASVCCPMVFLRPSLSSSMQEMSAAMG